MATVIFRENIAMGLAILSFDYGVLEFGSPDREPSDGLNVEATIRANLMEHGLRVPRTDFAQVRVRATARGNTLRIYWFEGQEPDEMEMGDAWMHAARANGSFVAIYLNLCPDNLSLSELVDMGAIAGIIELETE